MQLRCNKCETCGCGIPASFVALSPRQGCSLQSLSCRHVCSPFRSSLRAHAKRPTINSKGPRHHHKGLQIQLGTNTKYTCDTITARVARIVARSSVNRKFNAFSGAVPASIGGLKALMYMLLEDNCLQLPVPRQLQRCVLARACRASSRRTEPRARAVPQRVSRGRHCAPPDARLHQLSHSEIQIQIHRKAASV